MLLDLALASSPLPPKLSSLNDLSPNCAMSRYLKAMEQDVKAGRMKKQLGKWLIEDRTKDKDFTYRLTGKDSRLILHGFMYLVKKILQNCTNYHMIILLQLSCFQGMLMALSGVLGT